VYTKKGKRMTDSEHQASAVEKKELRRRQSPCGYCPQMLGTRDLNEVRPFGDAQVFCGILNEYKPVPYGSKSCYNQGSHVKGGFDVALEG
jgi:hypothetical protein